MAQAVGSDGGGQAEFAARIGKVLLKPQLAGLTQRADIFAEYLACGFSVREASDALGIRPKHGDVILMRMRRALGWQAV